MTGRLDTSEYHLCLVWCSPCPLPLPGSLSGVWAMPLHGGVRNKRTLTLLLSVCLCLSPLSLSVFLFLSLIVFLCLFPFSVGLYRPFPFSVYLSLPFYVCLSVSLSVCVFLCLSPSLLVFLCLSLSLSVFLCLSLSVFLCLFPSLSLPFYISPFLQLSTSLPIPVCLPPDLTHPNKPTNSHAHANTYDRLQNPDDSNDNGKERRLTRGRRGVSKG